jgi:nucleoside-diphosphate-sugar epimerase
VAQPSDDQRPATDEGGLATKIVMIGGTGLIGSKSVAILRQGGHEVIAAKGPVGSGADE